MGNCGALYPFFNMCNIGFLVFFLILALLGIAFLSQPMV
jgi:hypothetical protein